MNFTHLLTDTCMHSLTNKHTYTHKMKERNVTVVNTKIVKRIKELYKYKSFGG